MSNRALELVVVAALLGCIMVFGVALRLQDPLSTRALGAEDPYTHVVFTREWIKSGFFADSTQLATGMYPPGMHAWIVAFLPFTGISLYDFARLGPAFLSALGLLGLYAVGARMSGPAAGLAAAFLAAIMPEHIFRTELLFPTAFDLALLPLWILAFHLAITTHRLAGSILFVGASLPIAMMHPWVVPLFGAPLVLYAAIRFLRGKSERDSVLLAGALVVPPTAFAMASRWEESDTGFSDFLGHIPGLEWLPDTYIPIPLLFTGLLVGLGAASLAVVTLLSFVPRIHARGVRIGISLALCLAAFALLPILTRETPRDVNFHHMFGPIVFYVALAGLAVAYLWPTAVGDLGLAITAFLFPLTAIDVFNSRFWPQRTVVYLAVGVIFLGAAVVAATHALALLPARSDRARSLVTPAALVVLALVAVGSATAMPVNTYEWYRLYSDEQFHGLQEITERLDAEPGSRAVIQTWQPGLVLRTLTVPEHVRYSPSFFIDPAKRENVLSESAGPTYVLVERFTAKAAAAGKADLSFLEDARYGIVYETPDRALRLYEVRT